MDLAAQVEYPVCWLTIDALDIDPLRFLNHFAAAIQQQFPDFGGPTSSLLNNLDGSGLDREQALRNLINDLYDHVQEHFSLILDDFHLIDSSPEINQFINRFCQEMDENCHLVITSRTLLNLPDLPLMVARSQVHGLSFEELAFLPDEIKQLYQVEFQGELSQQDAERIVEETEGWITGFLLSAESLPGNPSAGTPIPGRGYRPVGLLCPDQGTGPSITRYAGFSSADLPVGRVQRTSLQASTWNPGGEKQLGGSH